MARILYFNDEEHKYTDDLGSVYLSTTTLLGAYKEKFDTKGQARRLAQLGKGVYKGKSAKQIEDMWKESTEAACAKGNVTHDGLENSIKEISIFHEAVKSISYKEDGVKGRLFTLDDVMGLDGVKLLDTKLFYETIGYKYPIIQKTIEYYVEQGWLLFAELGIYDEQRLISGMIDLFAYKYPYFVIIDWKTNKDDITFESGYYKRDHEGQTTNVYVRKRNDYMKYPIDDLPVCKGSDYGMQLSVYAKMCEQRGLIYGGSIIFHIRDQYVLNKYGMPFRDSKNNYIVDEAKGKKVQHIVMPYYSDQVDRVFAHHVKTNLKDGVQYKMLM